MPNVEKAAAIFHNAGLETVWNSALEEIDLAHPGKRPRARLLRSIDLENNFEGFKFNQKARFTG